MTMKIILVNLVVLYSILNPYTKVYLGDKKSGQKFNIIKSMTFLSTQSFPQNSVREKKFKKMLQ